MVEQLGPSASGRLSVGQRVVSSDWGQACYQEYVVVDEDKLVGARNFATCDEKSTVAFSENEKLAVSVWSQAAH